jgi:UPF0755 protein
MKRLLPVALILLLLAVGMAAGIWHQYLRFLDSPLVLANSGLTVNVERGATIRSVVFELEQMGITRMDWRWRLLSRLKPVTIKTGEYALDQGLLPSQLLDLLASGKVVNYRFTIIEGWTVRQLLRALAEDPVVQQTLDDLPERGSLPGTDMGNPEGWYLPETYLFVRGDTDVDILTRAHQSMRTALEQSWSGRAIGLPYETPYEMLTLASIIEKETSLESERAIIAGVFVRRLQEKWRLETDPTVIYGMGTEFKGNISRKDLQQDTAYNTYRRHGLPPTPIALPGVASLRAAAQPEAGTAMFFVADGQGGHTFSSTLEEHNKAVQQLLSGTRPEQKIKE